MIAVWDSLENSTPLEGYSLPPETNDKVDTQEGYARAHSVSNRTQRNRLYILQLGATTSGGLRRLKEDLVTSDFSR